jgi:anhydro-N-acetylmuramic acid kinase
MDRLALARSKDVRVIVGLNSGTAMDGVDAVVARVRGHGAAAEPRVVAFVARRYPPALRARLLRGPEATAAETCRLHRDVAEEFAEAAEAAIRVAGLAPADVDLVASHGQTLCHLPAAERTSTLQIGDLDVIAARLGAPVIGDFRAADVARGGAGAPLMPYLDRVLFRDRPGTVTLNLGGITSLTWLGAADRPPLAFDVGPANVPLDLLAMRITDGAQAADVDGRLAARGRVRDDVLRGVLAHPFLGARPPKTTGREEFGGPYVDALVARHRSVPLEDLLATHTVSIGRAVRDAIAAWVPGGLAGVAQVVVSGGGIHNPFLMTALAREVAPVPVATLRDAGIDPDAKEALLFALLGNDRLFGERTSFPSITGAREAVSLGKIAGGEGCGPASAR